jgi:glycosyltransferase involved in cell wall biosynthesis
MEQKNHSPKVLILCQLFYPELVSTGQTLTELGEQLVDIGVDVEVVCGPPTVLDRKTSVPKYIEYHGIRIRRAWGTRFSKLTLWGRMPNQLTYTLSTFFWLLFNRTKRPILVLTNPSFVAFMCAFFRRLGGMPYIFVIFDVHPDAAVKLGVIKENGIIARMWHFLNKFTFKHASAIVVLGRCMQRIIASERKAGNVARDRIHLIHIWGDDRLIKNVPVKDNPFRKQWNLDGKFVLSYSGNFGRFHDMETIMEAAKALKENCNIVFLFVGEGYKKPWMMKFAEKWNLNNCQFHTFVDRQELGLSLTCIDVGLVSLAKGQDGLSVPSKTFGILSASKPVIAVMSPDTEIAMIVKENNCGFIVEQGDVKALIDIILRLYEDRQLCTAMGKNGRIAIDRRYNVRHAAQEYKSLIKALQCQC